MFYVLFLGGKEFIFLKLSDLLRLWRNCEVVFVFIYFGVDKVVFFFKYLFKILCWKIFCLMEYLNYLVNIFVVVNLVVWFFVWEVDVNRKVRFILVERFLCFGM